MAFIPLIAMAVGGVMMAASQYMQGKAQSEAAKANADMKRLAAIEVGKEGAQKEQLFREKSNRFMSHQRAVIGAAGAELTGSPLDVMADQAYQAEMDALTIRHQTSLDKWKTMWDADMSDWQAKNYKTAGTMAAGSTILTTAGSMFGGGKGMFGAGAAGKGVSGGGLDDGMWSLEDERDAYNRRRRGY